MADRAYEPVRAVRDSGGGVGGHGALTDVKYAGGSRLDALDRVWSEIA